MLQGGNSPKKNTPSIQLLNQSGGTSIPSDLKREVSWAGLAILQDGAKRQACTAAHVEPGKLAIHRDCTSNANLQTQIFYWDNAGKQNSFSIRLNTTQQNPIQVFNLPESIVRTWKTAGNNPRIDETWIGGFNPDWELIRVYSFEADTKEGIYHFQINTCKAAKKSPLLKVVKPPSDPDDDEETISEAPIIPENTPYAAQPVIEKCHRPFSSSSRGALITLAKNFDEKFGFLTDGLFAGLPPRQLSTLQTTNKFQDGTFLRYIGADGMETHVPSDLSQIQINFSYSFETLFPRRKKLGLK